MSPRFVELLSASGMVSELACDLSNNDPTLQAFSAAQLWFLFTMSLQFADRKSETLTMLENALLKYPLPDADPNKQELVVEQLETQLESLLVEHHDSFTELDAFHDLHWEPQYKCTYLYRILECMLQKRNQPLPERASKILEGLPSDLRGLKSSDYLDGEAEA